LTSGPRCRHSITQLLAYNFLQTDEWPQLELAAALTDVSS
jgi:hypothetical protein